jgi:omega-6 fatty acid desaturase (delta-12 desaturase)
MLVLLSFHTGHECGHGGFSANPMVNDITGLIIHSFLLVPYFSWKISHRRHHSNTGNIERDEVFVPDVDYDQHAPKADLNGYIYPPDETDNYAVDFFAQLQGIIIRSFWLLIMLTLGWPAYLLYNVSSNKSYPTDTLVSHFLPNSPLFKSSVTFGREPTGQGKLVILSDLGMLAMGSGLWWLSTVYGFSNIAYYYLIPLMNNIGWLVTYTFLQHTDKQLPHYDSSEWDWLRGALATVDRDYGILNIFNHHIGDTHIVHHMVREDAHQLSVVRSPPYSVSLCNC